MTDSSKKTRLQNPRTFSDGSSEFKICYRFCFHVSTAKVWTLQSTSDVLLPMRFYLRPGKSFDTTFQSIYSPMVLGNKFLFFIYLQTSLVGKLHALVKATQMKERKAFLLTFIIRLTSPKVSLHVSNAFPDNKNLRKRRNRLEEGYIDPIFSV